MQICHVRACTGGHWSSTSSSPCNLKCNPLPGLQRNPTSGHNLRTKQRCFVAVSPLCTFTACSLLETEKQGGGRNQPEDAETMQLKRGLTPRWGGKNTQLNRGRESREANRERSSVPWTSESGDGGFSCKIIQLCVIVVSLQSRGRKRGAVQGAENHKRQAPPTRCRPRPLLPPRPWLAESCKSNSEWRRNRSWETR